MSAFASIVISNSDFGFSGLKDFIRSPAIVESLLVENCLLIVLLE